jgi:hypothetical protein
MILPAIQVRIAFDSEPFAEIPIWTDVTADAISFSTRRGRQKQLDRIECGVATLTLTNSSGNYWPSNTGGAYYPKIKPWKRINIRATYSGATYDIFTGFIEAWRPTWAGTGGMVPMMQLTCADLQKSISLCNLNDVAGYSEEKSGARIDNVLDDIGWPHVATADYWKLGTSSLDIDTILAYRDRFTDTGQSSIQASGALENVNAMEHIYSVIQTEMGIFYIGTDGNPKFQDRYARLKEPYLTSQATFGDDNGENHYHVLDPSYDDSDIYNDIRLTRAGGTEQVASDAASQSDYGIRTLARNNLLMTTDGEALDQSNYLKGKYANPSLSFKRMDIYPMRDPDNLFPKVLSYDISTRITLRLNQASIDQGYHIEGINHQYDTNKGAWVTQWQLSDADTQTYWVLGTSTLGTTTRLAY